MIVTARQLEDLHRQNGCNGQITLPSRARLTPLAADWLRARKILLSYSESDRGDIPSPPPVLRGRGGEGAASPQLPSPGVPGEGEKGHGVILWWCDVPAGPGKAAIVAHERESNLRALPPPADP